MCFFDKRVILNKDKIKIKTKTKFKKKLHMPTKYAYLCS